MFSPPAVKQIRHEHDYLGDFQAEIPLYERAGPLIDFLSKWDSSSITLPERVQDQWIDLYEHGYIEIQDISLVQAWLSSLIQVGYKFPPLKRRHRNVVVMGQFNYADKPSIVDDVIFWTQKARETFCEVVAAGPFSNFQIATLNQNSIKTMSTAVTRDGIGGRKGYFSPLDNLRRTLLLYRNSSEIQGVLYVHDDGLMNVTELTQGVYPFPSSHILLTPSFVGKELKMNQFNLDVRNASARLPVEQVLAEASYRMFSDGRVETIDKKRQFDSFAEMHSTVPLRKWPHYNHPHCTGGQQELTRDPESLRYHEEDGSMLFLPFMQSDFMFVPLACVDEFTEAAELHLRHNIFIECAFPKVVDMVQRKTNVAVRPLNLCTEWNNMTKRGSPEMIESCMSVSATFGLVHPFKMSAGYKAYAEMFDMSQ